jgi:hypothetical protein
VTDTRTRAAAVLTASLRAAIVRHPTDTDLQRHLAQLLNQITRNSN